MSEDISLQEVLRRLGAAASSDGTVRPGNRRSGRVRHYDEKKGYGFITPRGGGPDVFFYHKVVVGEVRMGQLVDFDVEQGEKGPRASYVRVTFIAEDGV